jgi:exonuclease III
MSCGLAILFNPRLIPAEVTHNADSEERCQRLTFNAEGLNLTVVNVYCPNAAKVRDEFLKALSERNEAVSNLIILF